MNVEEVNQRMWNGLCVCMIIEYMQQAETTEELDESIRQLERRGISVNLDVFWEHNPKISCDCY